MKYGIMVRRTAGDRFYYMAICRLVMKLKPGDDPVVVVVRAGVPEDFCAAAASCGVALIKGAGPDLVVGRESSVALLDEVLTEAPDARRARADCRRLLHDFETTTKSPRGAMEDQIALLKVQHKICEVELGFRIWPDDPEFEHGGPEVQLRRAANGRTLHGIVWGWNR